VGVPQNRGCLSRFCCRWSRVVTAALGPMDSQLALMGLNVTHNANGRHCKDTSTIQGMQTFGHGWAVWIWSLAARSVLRECSAGPRVSLSVLLPVVEGGDGGAGTCGFSTCSDGVECHTQCKWKALQGYKHNTGNAVLSDTARPLGIGGCCMITRVLLDLLKPQLLPQLEQY